MNECVNVNVNLIEKKVIQIKGKITINIDVSVKNIPWRGKNWIWNPSTCSCEKGKYLGSIMNDSVITYDETVESNDEEKRTIPTNFNKKKTTYKTNFLLSFYWLL